jgi:hypothetical protein
MVLDTGSDWVTGFMWFRRFKGVQGVQVIQKFRLNFLNLPEPS